MTIYRHISEAKRAKGLSVSLQCELLGVSESGYWGWIKRPPSDRALHDAWLTERIRAIHAASSGRYGSRGCTPCWLARGSAWARSAWRG